MAGVIRRRHLRTARTTTPAWSLPRWFPGPGRSIRRPGADAAQSALDLDRARSHRRSARYSSPPSGRRAADMHELTRDRIVQTVNVVTGQHHTLRRGPSAPSSGLAGLATAVLSPATRSVTAGASRRQSSAADLSGAVYSGRLHSRRARGWASYVKLRRDPAIVNGRRGPGGRQLVARSSTPLLSDREHLSASQLSVNQEPERVR